MENETILENTQRENFPKKKKGRPKAFDSSMEAILKESFPETKTQRSLQNKFYLLRAFRLVKNDPTLKWLYDKEAQTIQSTILGELGRIDRDEDLLNMAREICGLKPKVRDAILSIRAWRRSRKATAPPATERQTSPPTPVEPEQKKEPPQEQVQETHLEVEIQPPPQGEDVPMGDFAIWDYDEAAPKL